MKEQALALLRQYNESEALVQHGREVGAILEHFAQKAGEDPDYWGSVGLLHDVDYEKYPEEHCKKAVDILKEVGYDEAFIHAVVSHGYGLCSDVAPEKTMEKVLFAADELTGLIGAAAKMRPSKSCTDMELSSLKKKFKDKKFAAGCSRDVIRQGAENLGWELDELLGKVLAAMAESEAAVAQELEALS